jgi:hypothetical protein
MQKVGWDAPSSRQTLPAHRNVSGYWCLIYIILTIYHVLTTYQIVLALANFERVKRILAVPDDACKP